MSKHTPGPWNVMENGFGLTHNVPTVYATDEELRFIAFCEDRINMVPTPNLANARLISAAPELLEALKDFSEYVSTEQNSTDGAVTYSSTQINRLAFKSRAAIAKAEGETK